MSRLVADVIVDVLRQAGVKRCYGIPGDTLNHICGSIQRSDMRWILVRHEEAGGFAAGADAQLTGELAACAGSCGPGSLHFINGLADANRNGAPVVLIASQIVRDELGFDFPQELDFKALYSSLSVYCDEIRTPEQAQRKTVLACQAAINERGVAVLIVPTDVSSSHVEDQHFAVHRARPSLCRAKTSLTALPPCLTRATASRSMAASDVNMPTTRWWRSRSASKHLSLARPGRRTS